ncbi:DUF2330 domain-containing protein [candidate division WOR-3 bacterium]|nr:DUF2330 domain-containing protein [candidate division WOR-3 bacterium]
MLRLSALALVVCGLAFGDGGMVPGPEGMIREYGQVALLSHFEGREQLALASSYTGDARRFAWIVPLPSEPDVDSVLLDFFFELQTYTQPLYRSGGGFGCASPEPLPGGGRYGGDSMGVEEIAHGVVGDYEYEVLRVDIAESLTAYLEREGFEPGAEPTPVFQHYLDKAWRYFFVAQVRDSLREYESHSVGIRLSFTSESAVYPLHISRIGSTYTGVILYVFAEHRMHFPGAELWFSGQVGPETFFSDAGFVDRRCRLTKLMKYYRPEQMEDVALVRAPDDRDFRRVVSGGDWYGSFGPMLLLGGLLLARRRAWR